MRLGVQEYIRLGSRIQDYGLRLYSVGSELQYGHRRKKAALQSISGQEGDTIVPFFGCCCIPPL